MTTNSDDVIHSVYERWHETILRRDLAGLVALYAEDGRFESPAVWALNGRPDGVLRGRQEIHSFFEVFFGKLDKNVAEWFRTGTFFSDGRQLVWEYPRETPKGDQVDLVEAMDIENGLIVHHRVYWGWIGFKTLIATLDRSR